MIKHTYTSNEPFTFETGETLPSVDVAYHCSKEGYTGQKVIWICHALTADSNPTDWWESLCGEGKLLDPRKYFIICCNMLGSCYGSSGPSSINPETGEPYYFSFPRPTVRDIVRCQNFVREHLGIEHIDFLIGSSIGGFQALEWAIMYPEVVRKAIFMATLERVRPWLTAFEESQRMALEADQTFRECKSLKGGEMGLRCARTIALISYRNEVGYNMRQWEQDIDTVFADRAGSYQRYQGKKLSDRFDAYSYYYLSFGVDSENVGRGRGGVEKALARIKADSLVVGIDSDLIFPAYEMKEMAELIGCPYKEITSYFGHDGFLLEKEQITDILTPILEQL